ncbi:hypothetical protein SF06_00290 [Pseudomonas flexibilis]|nr:hypothetical protein SF06_00290 [Pseudomonas flexibilis]
MGFAAVQGEGLLHVRAHRNEAPSPDARMPRDPEWGVQRGR